MIFFPKNRLLNLTIDYLKSKKIIIKNNKINIDLNGPQSYYIILGVFILIIAICFVDFRKALLTDSTLFIVDEKDLSDRISNLSTIIGLSLTISTLLINNLASKKKEYYELLFKKTKLFPIVYFAIGLLVFLLLVSLFKHSKFLPPYFITNSIIAGYYLIIMLIISIAYLFKNIINVYNQSYLKAELFLDFKRDLKADRLNFALQFYSKKLYCELTKPYAHYNFTTTTYKGIEIDLTGRQLKNIDLNKLLKILNRIHKKNIEISMPYFLSIGLHEQYQSKKTIMYLKCDDLTYNRLKKDILRCFTVVENGQRNQMNSPIILKNVMDNIFDNLSSSKLVVKEFEESIQYLVESIKMYSEDDDPINTLFKENDFTPLFLIESIDLLSIETAKNIGTYSNNHIESIIGSIYHCILKTIFKHPILFNIILRNMVYIYTKNPNHIERESYLNKQISTYLSELEIWKIIYHDNNMDAKNKIQFVNYFYYNYVEYLFTLLNRTYYDDWQSAFENFKKSAQSLTLDSEYTVNLKRKELELQGDIIASNKLITYQQYKKHIFEVRACIEFCLQSWLFFLIENKKVPIESKWLEQFDLAQISTEELFNLFFRLMNDKFSDSFIGINNWDHIEDRGNFDTYSPPQVSYWLSQGLYIELFRRGTSYLNIDLIDVNPWSSHITENARQIFILWEKKTLNWFSLLKCKDIIEFDNKKQNILTILSKLHAKYQIKTMKENLNTPLVKETTNEIQNLINKNILSSFSASNIFGINASLSLTPNNNSLKKLEFYQIIPNSKHLINTGSLLSFYSESISKVLKVNLEYHCINQILETKPIQNYNNLASALNNTIFTLHKNGFTPSAILIGRSLYFEIVDFEHFEYYIPGNSQKFSGFYYGVPIVLIDDDIYKDILVITDIKKAFDLQIGLYEGDNVIKLSIDTIEEDESKRILLKEPKKWKFEIDRELSDEEALLKIRNSLKFQCSINWRILVKEKLAYEASKVVPEFLKKTPLVLPLIDGFQN